MLLTKTDHSGESLNYYRRNSLKRPSENNKRQNSPYVSQGGILRILVNFKICLFQCKLNNSEHKNKENCQINFTEYNTDPQT